MRIPLAKFKRQNHFQIEMWQVDPEPRLLLFYVEVICEQTTDA